MVAPDSIPNALSNPQPHKDVMSKFVTKVMAILKTIIPIGIIMLEMLPKRRVVMMGNVDKLFHATLQSDSRSIDVYLTTVE